MSLVDPLEQRDHSISGAVSPLCLEKVCAFPAARNVYKSQTSLKWRVVSSPFIFYENMLLLLFSVLSSLLILFDIKIPLIRVTQMASSSPEHIITIGAGFGGLLLAHGLKKHGISFSVYERD